MEKAHTQGLLGFQHGGQSVSVQLCLSPVSQVRLLHLWNWLRTNHNTPLPPPLQTKGIFVSISVLNDLLSGNPQNRCQGVIPFSCVYKDSLIFRQLNELFFQFYKVSSSILRPISMKSEHTQRKSIRKRPKKQLKNFWSCLNVEFVFKILPRPLTNEM